LRPVEIRKTKKEKGKRKKEKEMAEIQKTKRERKIWMGRRELLMPGHLKLN